MDQQPEPAEARLPIQSRGDIGRKPNRLQRRGEHELPRVQDERLALLHLDQLGQVLLRLLRVDVGSGVVAEDAEVAVDPEVDRRRLDPAFQQRVDHDRARLERLADRAVRQDHGGPHTIAVAADLAQL